MKVLNMAAAMLGLTQANMSLFLAQEMDDLEADIKNMEEGLSYLDDSESVTWREEAWTYKPEYGDEPYIGTCHPIPYGKVDSIKVRAQYKD